MTTYMAEVAPAAPASRVLTAFSPSVSELMLNPNHPKNRMNVPITDVGYVVSLEVSALAEAAAGADDNGSGQGEEAAYHVDDGGTGVVGHAHGGEPAVAAPGPVSVYGIDDRADDEAVSEVGVYLGALGDRARDDGGGGSGEDHLEEPADQSAVVEVNEEEIPRGR